VLQTADIPPGLKFVTDKKDSQHDLLAATEKMTVAATCRQTQVDRRPHVGAARREESAVIDYRFPQEKDVALILARALADEAAIALIERGYVNSLEEAVYLSQFFWRMVDIAAKGDVQVPFDGSANFWTEKLYNSIGAYLKSAGYAKAWNDEIDKA